MGSWSCHFKDPFPALSHWAGAVLSSAALAALLVGASPTAWHVVAFSVYGASMVALYVASALAHTVHCSPQSERRLERLDYAAIFLLIAGTHTPICLITLRGPWGWSIFGAQWLLALVGIILVTCRRHCPTGIRVSLYLLMGWMAVVAIVPIISAMPPAGLIWLLVGGAAYTVGAVVFVTGRPNLWPRYFESHDLWHTLVLVGSACHFVVMWAFVAVA